MLVEIGFDSLLFLVEGKAHPALEPPPVSRSGKWSVNADDKGVRDFGPATSQPQFGQDHRAGYDMSSARDARLSVFLQLCRTPKPLLSPSTSWLVQSHGRRMWQVREA